MPIGPEVRRTAQAPAATTARPTPEQRRHLLDAMVGTQFTTISAAAEGCDVVVAGGTMMIAARSVAELLGIRYAYTSFCPVTLPSPHHAPIPVWGQVPESADHRTLWAQDARHWNEGCGAALNEAAEDGCVHWLAVTMLMGLVLFVCDGNAARLGTCASASCGRAFIDRSKNSRKVYCSDVCAHRESVAAYRARRRQGQ